MEGRLTFIINLPDLNLYKRETWPADSRAAGGQSFYRVLDKQNFSRGYVYAAIQSPIREW
jgi:hypothetical protein